MPESRVMRALCARASRQSRRFRTSEPREPKVRKRRIRLTGVGVARERLDGLEQRPCIVAPPPVTGARQLDPACTLYATRQIPPCFDPNCPVAGAMQDDGRRGHVWQGLSNVDQ